MNLILMKYFNKPIYPNIQSFHHVALNNHTPRFDIHEGRDYHMDNAGLDRGGETAIETLTSTGKIQIYKTKPQATLETQRKKDPISLW